MYIFLFQVKASFFFAFTLSILDKEHVAKYVCEYTFSQVPYFNINLSSVCCAKCHKCRTFWWTWDALLFYRKKNQNTSFTVVLSLNAVSVRCNVQFNLTW